MLLKQSQNISTKGNNENADFHGMARYFVNGYCTCCGKPLLPNHAPHVYSQIWCSSPCVASPKWVTIYIQLLENKTPYTQLKSTNLGLGVNRRSVYKRLNQQDPTVAESVFQLLTYNMCCNNLNQTNLSVIKRICNELVPSQVIICFRKGW